MNLTHFLNTHTHTHRTKGNIINHKLLKNQCEECKQDYKITAFKLNVSKGKLMYISVKPIFNMDENSMFKSLGRN